MRLRSTITHAAADSHGHEATAGAVHLAHVGVGDEEVLGVAVVIDFTHLEVKMAMRAHHAALWQLPHNDLLANLTLESARRMMATSQQATSGLVDELEFGSVYMRSWKSDVREWAGIKDVIAKMRAKNDLKILFESQTIRIFPGFSPVASRRESDLEKCKRHKNEVERSKST